MQDGGENDLLMSHRIEQLISVIALHWTTILLLMTPFLVTTISVGCFKTKTRSRKGASQNSELRLKQNSVSDQYESSRRRSKTKKKTNESRSSASSSKKMPSSSKRKRRSSDNERQNSPEQKPDRIERATENEQKPTPPPVPCAELERPMELWMSPPPAEQQLRLSPGAMNVEGQWWDIEAHETLNQQLQRLVKHIEETKQRQQQQNQFIRNETETLLPNNDPLQPMLSI